VGWLTLAVGLVGGLGIGSWVSGWRERSHASTEARAARRFQIRFEAYKAASHYLSRHEQWIDLTEPFMGPAPDAPDLEPYEEWIEFGGLIAVTASDAVRDAMRAAVDGEVAFVHAVGEYRRWNQRGKVDSDNPGQDMHEARLAAIAAIRNAQTVMRDELADL